MFAMEDYDINGEEISKLNARLSQLEKSLNPPCPPSNIREVLGGIENRYLNRIIELEKLLGDSVSIIKQAQLEDEFCRMAQSSLDDKSWTGYKG